MLRGLVAHRAMSGVEQAVEAIIGSRRGSRSFYLGEAQKAVLIRLPLLSSLRGRESRMRWLTR
jgi:hypothetical protein